MRTRLAVGNALLAIAGVEAGGLRSIRVAGATVFLPRLAGGILVDPLDDLELAVEAWRQLGRQYPGPAKRAVLRSSAAISTALGIEEGGTIAPIDMGSDEGQSSSSSDYSEEIGLIKEALGFFGGLISAVTGSSSSSSGSSNTGSGSTGGSTPPPALPSAASEPPWTLILGALIVVLILRK